MNTMHSPLKNKNWLFTETGKEGFHYDDVSNAVVGLKKDLIESLRRFCRKIRFVG